ncbi:hypothetical protein PIB30_045406 [Stylosanthes scabra]|uniref:Uncharacterized protein n=1 Tax=Stylosanthes scabra TaxID=79078 RepID=A0ABU6YEG6_9FABA|nr:hypothetical protein [Stylosanthes scabra]
MRRKFLKREAGLDVNGATTASLSKDSTSESNFEVGLRTAAKGAAWNGGAAGKSIPGGAVSALCSPEVWGSSCRSVRRRVEKRKFD